MNYDSLHDGLLKPIF